jgi:peptidoglycan/LPS O-acetylase OafA/YrhL
MHKHIPQLDGVRGLAVLIVVIGHIVVFGFGMGIKKLGFVPPTGVNLFFVLSGFLITNILINTKTSDRYYWSFYARRALRIWPLYFVVLFICYGLLNHHLSTFSFDQTKVRWYFFAAFIQNLVYRQPGMLGPLALAATWSLAVEEQFYFIWPSLVRFLDLKKLTYLLVTVILAAPIVRLIVTRIGWDPYINPLCRFDGMAFGALAALWLLRFRPSKDQIVKVIQWGMLVFVVGELVGGKLGWTAYTSKTFVNLAFTCLLLATLSISAFQRAFSVAWLRYIGTISYGFYLLHALVAVGILAILPGTSLSIRIARSLAIFIGSIGLSSLSWHLMESRVNSLKRFFPASSKRTPDPASRDGVMPTISVTASEPVL